MSNELVDLDDVEFLGESPSGMAIFIKTADGKQVSIPKSLCEWDQHSKVLTMERWKAEQEGLV